MSASATGAAAPARGPGSPTCSRAMLDGMPSCLTCAALATGRYIRTGHCALCHLDFLDDELGRHLREHHPDLFVDAVYWPDGQPVVDMSAVAEVGDFTDGP